MVGKRWKVKRENETAETAAVVQDGGVGAWKRVGTEAMTTVDAMESEEWGPTRSCDAGIYTCDRRFSSNAPNSESELQLRPALLSSQLLLTTSEWTNYLLHFFEVRAFYKKNKKKGCSLHLS